MCSIIQMKGMRCWEIAVARNISSMEEKVVGCRTPKQPHDTVHNKRIFGCIFVNDGNGSGIGEVNNNFLILKEWTPKY